MPGARTSNKLAPRIVELPPRTVAVIHTRGDPNVVGPAAIQALYGAVYTHKFAQKKQGRDFKVEALRARWSGATLSSEGGITGAREEWEGPGRYPCRTARGPCRRRRQMCRWA